MVIFGAGASYDSSQRYPPNPIPKERAIGKLRFHGEEHERLRPPLTNELFARSEFNEFSTRVPKLLGIAGILQDLPKGSLETELEALDALATRNPLRAQQLVAFRYYLSLLLSNIPHRWLHAIGYESNYSALLEQIRDHDNQPVCLVTFNYDLLLEKALGWEIARIDDYIQNDWKLIKLHGSVNWARPIRSPDLDHPNHNHMETMNRIVEAAPALEFGEEHTLIPFASKYPEKLLNEPIGKPDRPEDPALFPAIAIPLPGKLGPECPSLLMDVLMRCIPDVDKLLILGWAGKERHFLQILRDNGLRSDVKGLVVSGDEKSANAAIQEIRKGDVSVEGLRPFSGGFREFVTQNGLRLLYENSGRTQ